MVYCVEASGEAVTLYNKRGGPLQIDRTEVEASGRQVLPMYSSDLLTFKSHHFHEVAPALEQLTMMYCVEATGERLAKGRKLIL